MSTLASATLSPSDTDDDDYVPPPPSRPHASRASRASGTSDVPPDGPFSESETESAAADAFFIADAVPDHPDSDVERFTDHMPGVASSAPTDALAPIAEEENDEENDAAPTTTAANGTANGAADAAPSSPADMKGNDGDAELSADGATNDAETGAKNDHDSAAAAAASNGEEKPSDEATGAPSSYEKVSTCANKVSNSGEKQSDVSAATSKGEKKDGNSAADVPNDDKKVSIAPANAAKSDKKTPPATDDALLVARAAAKKVKKGGSAARTQSVEALWREMYRGTTTKKKRSTAAHDGGLGAWLSPSGKKTSPAKPVRLPRLEEATERSAAEAAAAASATAKAAADAAEAERPTKRSKRGTGLEAVLNAARGGDTRGPNTLDRTKENWKEFKKGDEEVTDELEAYKKDKSRYTDRVSFLERSSHREWEVEQAGKKTR